MEPLDQLKKLDTVVRLSVKNSESESGSVFGRGIADLCLGVRERGSLNAAAKNMGMAYSKAWRIIKDTEAALGIQLLNRDGAHGSDLYVLISKEQKLPVLPDLEALTEGSDAIWILPEDRNMPERYKLTETSKSVEIVRWEV